MERLDVTAAPLGVTAAGVNVQVVPAGRPVQPRVTALAKPFCGVSLTVVVAGVPAEAVPLVGLALSWKLPAATDDDLAAINVSIACPLVNRISPSPRPVRSAVLRRSLLTPRKK